MTTTILNTKNSEVENKIPDTSSLVTATVFNTKNGKVEDKISEHAKYFANQVFNKFTGETSAARLIQANLVSKADYYQNKLISFNRKMTSNKTKYLGSSKKLDIATAKDYHFFLEKMYFTNNNGSQNTFVYQSALDTLKSKKLKELVMFLDGNQRQYVILNLSHYIFFLPRLNFSGYRTGIKFDKDPLAVEQNNYLSKILNVYIFYDLDARPRNPTHNFKFKNGLFGVTSAVKNSDKWKYVYSGYGKTFDSVGSCSFDNEIARNVIISGVDNSSLSHVDNSKN